MSLKPVLYFEKLHRLNNQLLSKCIKGQLSYTQWNTITLRLLIVYNGQNYGAPNIL